jgi:uncharacterized integral membrane protein
MKMNRPFRLSLYLYQESHAHRYSALFQISSVRGCYLHGQPDCHHRRGDTTDGGVPALPAALPLGVFALPADGGRSAAGWDGCRAPDPSAQVLLPRALLQEQPRSPGVATRRLEAFSDAVFAIAITLLALNLQVPMLTTVTPQALAATLAAKWPTYLGFLLSFVTLLIAWVYHHRLLQAAKRARTGLLFTNGTLLLIVSWVPFPTALLGAYLTTPAASVVCAIYAGYIGALNFTYNPTPCSCAALCG